jgi:uncharacterized coiled-coil DUF342 family protein
MENKDCMDIIDECIKSKNECNDELKKLDINSEEFNKKQEECREIIDECLCKIEECNKHEPKE